MNKKSENALDRMSDSKTNILHWFFSFPNSKVSLTELANRLRISKITANKLINELAKEGFIIKEEIGRSWRLSCNQKHQYNNYLKVPYHLSEIYLSKVISQIYDKIPNARAIILFGSYRKGDDIETSDIDIAVEVLDNKPLKIIEIGKISIGFRKNIQVNLHVFSRKNINSNLFANIANGIVLEGFLEVKP